MEALMLRGWWVQGNWIGILGFFKSKQNDDVLNTIFEMFEEKIRKNLLRNVIKGFGPKIRLSVLDPFMKFDDGDSLNSFLRKSDAVLSEDGLWLLNRESKNIIA
jgi:hypothetical protein